MKNFEKLSRSEMKNVLGGGGQSPIGGIGSSCAARCDQDKSATTDVTDCSSATVSAACGDLSNAVCVCA